MFQPASAVPVRRQGARKPGITDPGYSADVETTGASRVRFSGVIAEGVMGSPAVCFRYG
jgi:hypothetical protein